MLRRGTRDPHLARGRSPPPGPAPPQDRCGRRRPWTRRPPSPFQIVKERGEGLALQGRLPPSTSGILHDRRETVNRNTDGYAHFHGRSAPLWEESARWGGASARMGEPSARWVDVPPQRADHPSQRADRLSLWADHPPQWAGLPARAPDRPPTGWSLRPLGRTVRPNGRNVPGQLRIVRPLGRTDTRREERPARHKLCG